MVYRHQVFYAWIKNICDLCRNNSFNGPLLSKYSWTFPSNIFLWIRFCKIADFVYVICPLISLRHIVKISEKLCYNYASKWEMEVRNGTILYESKRTDSVEIAIIWSQIQRTIINSTKIGLTYVLYKVLFRLECRDMHNWLSDQQGVGNPPTAN